MRCVCVIFRFSLFDCLLICSYFFAIFILQFSSLRSVFLSTFCASVDCTFLSVWLCCQLAPKINHAKLSVCYTVYHSSVAHTFIAYILLLLSLNGVETKLREQPMVKTPIKRADCFFRWKFFYFCEQHLQTAHYHLNTFLFVCVLCVCLGTTCQNYTYSTHRVHCTSHSPKYRLDFNELSLNHRCCLIIYCSCCHCAFWQL